MLRDALSSVVNKVFHLAELTASYPIMRTLARNNQGPLLARMAFDTRR